MLAGLLWGFSAVIKKYHVQKQLRKERLYFSFPLKVHS